MSTEANKIQKRKERFAGTYDTDLVKTTSTLNNEKEKKLARQKRFGEEEPLKGNKTNRRNKDNLGDVSV